MLYIFLTIFNVHTYQSIRMENKHIREVVLLHKSLSKLRGRRWKCATMWSNMCINSQQKQNSFAWPAIFEISHKFKQKNETTTRHNLNYKHMANSDRFAMLHSNPSKRDIVCAPTNNKRWSTYAEVYYRRWFKD